MIDTMEKVLYPLRITAFIIGIGMPRNSVNHLKRRLSVLYLFIVWIVYVCSFHYVVILFTPRRVFPYVISLFMILINQFVTIISIIIVICYNKKFGICINRLCFVNDTLEELGIGTTKEYGKMHNTLIRVLVIWFVMACVTTIADAFYCIETLNDTRAAIIPLVMDYTLHVNTLTDIMFMLLLRHLHSELCRVARDINGLFGIQMTLQMMSYFVVLTGLIYLQYKLMLCLEQSHDHKMNLKLLFSSDIWFIVILAKVISMNHICESASAKAQKTKQTIHKLTNLTRFAEAREEICQFVLQLSLRPLKFSGMGLFYFGYTFTHKFFIQILTFIIIMVQMNTSTESSVSIFNKNVSCYVVM